MVSKTHSGKIPTSRHSVVKALKKNPQASKITDKLIKSNASNTRGYSNRQSPMSPGIVKNISDKTTSSIQDNNNLFQLLPDTLLAEQILVSSILSPKDLMSVELGYRCDNQHINGELSGKLLEVIRNFFNDDYKIKKFLPEMLGDILFHKGSYPLLILPENQINKVINSDKSISLESISAAAGLTAGKSDKLSMSIGLLGDPTKKDDRAGVALENIGMASAIVSEEHLEVKYDHNAFKNATMGTIKVVDNPNILSMPSILDLKRTKSVSDKLGMRVSFESRVKQKEFTGKEVYNALFRNANYQHSSFISLSKGSIGEDDDNPMIAKLPPESVIPVHTPSNPSDHKGYFILLDMYGNFLNRVTESDYYQDLSSNLDKTNIASQLLDRGATAMDTNSRLFHEQELNEIVRVYSEVVEKDLVNRLKNGVYGENIEISGDMDVYRVMFSRALAQKGTQILYVPAELVTYMAFDYNSHGVGKSLLEDSKVLASIRSTLMFADTMARIKNSTGNTSVKIELDPDDPDPETTINYMLDQYMKNRQSMTFAANPLDIIDFLQNAGVDVQVSGNPAYPETKLDVEDFSSNKTEIDSELKDDIDKKYFMSLGLSPETIDMTTDIEFATSIVSSNILLAKRVIIYQDMFMEFVREFIIKYSVNSGMLTKQLVDLIEDNKSSLSTEYKALNAHAILDKFFDSLEVSLPRPDSTKIENQREAFDKYTSFLEEAMDSYVNEDMLDMDGFEDSSTAVLAIREALMSYFKREWLQNNNVLPELMDIVSEDSSGKPVLDLKEIHGNHTSMLGKSINSLIIKMKKDEAKRIKRMEKAQDKLDNPDEEEVEETSTQEIGNEPTPEEDVPVENDDVVDVGDDAADATDETTDVETGEGEDLPQ